MKEKAQKFYLTTAIAYVNAAPHIGHTLEFVQADALCRYHNGSGSLQDGERQPRSSCRRYGVGEFCRSGAAAPR